MKFSVLLPTRNRLKYLKYAVSSVLAQDYGEWEVIVSDNDSHEKIHEYVQSLKDHRVKYFRTKEFVSVTENWNNALNHSSGEYAIMLGDDDILLKNYFSTMIKLLKQYDNPNLIYSNAYIYAYPGVIEQNPDGYLQSCKHYHVFQNATEPFWMSKKLAMKLVEGHLNFKALFGTNMQFILMKRSQIEKVKVNNQLFHSPYPDVYAMNILMLEAENILVYPGETVVIGVTPKSTGNFLVNENEKKGMEFLNISNEMASIPSLSSTIMPGSYSLTCWLISMETVKLYFKDRYKLVVNYGRYRLLQIEQVIKGYFSKKKTVTKKELGEALRILTLKEKAGFFLPLFFLHIARKIYPRFLKNPISKVYNKIFALSDIVGSGAVNITFPNIFRIFENHENGKIYSDSQIRSFLEDFSATNDVQGLCKKLGVSLKTLDSWKTKFDKDALSNEEIFLQLKNEIDTLKKMIDNLKVKA